jgi:hypothetical protein
MQLALESTGNFAGRLQGQKRHSLQSNLFLSLTGIRYPHPRGPSKRYTNLVIWSRPRIHTVCAWPFTSSLPGYHLAPIGSIFCSILEVSAESSKLSSSIVTVLLASQVALVFYQPLSSTAAVLLNFSGCGCLLPVQVQLQYFLTSQAVVVFYH